MHPSRSPGERGGRSARLLPPLVITPGTINVTGAYSPGGSRSKVWSYYHRDCVAKDLGPAFISSEKTRSASVRDWLNPSIRPTTLPMLRDDDELSMAEFLDRNRPFLENYVLDCVPLSEIKRWLTKKIEMNGSRPVEGGVMKNTQQSDTTKKDIFLSIVDRLKDNPNELSVLWELASTVVEAVGADAYRVFKLFPNHPDFIQYIVASEHDGSLHLERVDAKKVVFAVEAAESGKTVSLSRSDNPDNFPDAAQELFGAQKQMADFVMYQPVLAADGRASYVVEMWRCLEPFTCADKGMSANFLVCGSLVLHYCNLYMDKKRERNMSDFLLEVVKAIFEEMVSLDLLIKRILEFAQRLVNADRASLFLVDYRNFELVSTVFDLKFEPGQSRDVEKKEIRMPINRGIAGHVALSGETMNIPDAYSDYRFNREVDEKTGYKTINILCMPVKVQGKVIGVVQMVNKRNDQSFQHEDEVAFEIFSTFFGLALHNARLYDRIMRNEQKYRVALEVLSYHNTCRENEVQSILRDNEKTHLNLNDFYFDQYKLNEFEKCKAVITMFDELFDLSKFDVQTVTRFILTVKKNYRTVPYHNFDHGWSVAHSMYVILKNDIRKRYDYKARLALFVASLCHDLDHRGYTNKYMSETASPLAAMYSTSTLEHHHFNITVSILQQDGHNIFSHMTSEDYKEILGYIRQCILATDLAAFFPNLAKMNELHGEEPQFSWTNLCHRDLAMAVSMTAADLSASAKPWETQIKTVKVIFEEFYDQGDKEKLAGRTPIPMMDRDKPDELPSSQVGFLSQICVPCYKMLYTILPKTKPMYVMALRNLHNWKSKADHINLKLQNGEEVNDVEVEDVPEKILLSGDIEVAEEEDEIEEFKANKIEMVGDGEMVLVEARDEPKIMSFEEPWEEEDSIKAEEKIGRRLSKNLEGVTWIDEEDVVIKPNSELPIFKNEPKPLPEGE